MKIGKLLIVVGASALVAMAAKHIEEENRQKRLSDAIDRQMIDFRERMRAQLDESSKRLAALSKSMAEQRGDIHKINEVLKEIEPET